MIQYLVLVENTDVAMSFVDRYRVYNDLDKALEWATENGYYSMMPLNKKVGMLNISKRLGRNYGCKGGDIDVSIMAVEARDE